MGTWRRRALISAAFTGAALIAVAAVACGGGSGSSYGGSSSSPTVKAVTPASGGAVAAATTTNSGYGSTAGGAATSGGIAVGNTSLGSVLVDGTGMTLYLFAKDTANDGKSACYGQCATNWPPASATSVPAKPAGASGTLAAITRDDGTMQLTYNGMPLYRFAADKAPGDTKGDGVGGVWSVAKP